MLSYRQGVMVEKVTASFLSFVSCELNIQPCSITASYTRPEKATQLSLRMGDAFIYCCLVKGISLWCQAKSKHIQQSLFLCHQVFSSFCGKGHQQNCSKGLSCLNGFFEFSEIISVQTFNLALSGRVSWQIKGVGAV